MLEGTKESVYRHKVATVKKYGNRCKLRLHTVLREKGWEEVKNSEPEKEKVKYDHKLRESIRRTRARIFELAVCNEWQYFITCTLDKQKYQRDDLNRFRTDIAQFMRDKRKAYKTPMAYILIPELHKDKQNWHMHGLINGIPPDKVAKFIAGKHPRDLIDKNYINWPDYEKRFGFISLDVIRETESVSGYLQKYITKDLSRTVQELGAHMFYCSHGLKGAEVIKEGQLAKVPIDWDFMNYFVRIKVIDESEVDYYVRDGPQVKELDSLPTELAPNRP